jgi:hypothetical protein
VRHPVLDDPDRVTWDQYAVRAWPTLVLVDPAGYAVATFEGEGNAPKLERVIADMISDHRERGTLNETPIETLPPAVPCGPLRFPGKVAAGPDGLLAVSDSGHDRVIVARVDETGSGAEVVAVAGTGTRGMGDGAFSEAAFHDPQGLLFVDERSLLVADTGNHAIRRLDVANGTVVTVAGTGKQARWGAGGVPAKETPLNSPWDLELWDRIVVIAMAGSHQLWSLELEKGEVGVLAGSGAGGLADGPARTAAMAQPSGLAAENGKLWVVDSETSSLRYLDRSGRLTTAVGVGLFDFGHEDGPAESALLQHPLGVVATPEGPVVCDTYNSALRRYDPEKEEVSTLACDGLGEPSGGAILAGGYLVVADTDNHRLARVDAGGEARTFEVRGLLPPAPRAAEEPTALEIGPLELAPEVELTAPLPIPEGRRLDPSLGPPVQLSVSSDELLTNGDLLLTSNELPAEATLSLNDGEGTIDILLRVGTCEEGPAAVCILTERRWRVKASRDPEGSPRINLGLGG